MSEYPEDISRAAVKAVLDAPIEVPRSTSVIGMVAKAIQEYDQRDRWQTIDTAPKDGTTIMTYPHYRVTHWEDTDKVFGDQPAFVGRWDEGFDAWWGLDPPPTHWTPLLVAPSKAKQAEPTS